MTETNGADLDLILHGVNLKLAHVTSELAEKAHSDNAQTKLILQTIGRFIGVQLKPLKEEIAQLKARLEEIEKRGVEYRGVYQRALSYRRGSMVTADGNLWACIADAAENESPGSHPSKWQLTVKAGRDGRDVPRQPTQGGPRQTTTTQRRT